MSRFRVRALALWCLGTLVAAFAIASIDWCSADATAPSVVASGRRRGSLEVGAGRAELRPPYPVVRAGYGPPRPDATEARHPLFARALVFRVEDVKVALVSLDLLLVPPELVARLRELLAPQGFSSVWVTATHTHSSMGAYDARWVPAIAGTGRFDDGIEHLLVEAALASVRAAESTRAPAALHLADGTLPGLFSRTGAPKVDERLTRVWFTRDGRPFAEWVIAAAHPTFVPRQGTQLDPDFPGAYSRRREQSGGMIALFSQAAIGDVSAEAAGDDEWARIEELSQRVVEAAEAAHPRTVEAGGDVVLAFASARVPVPDTDASRLVAAPWEGATENLLCLSSTRAVEVAALQLGPLRVVSVPGEPTTDAGEALEQAAGVDRVVSLANGYIGYVETAERVRQGAGESRRQYYVPELLEYLQRGATVARDALRR